MMGTGSPLSRNNFSTKGEKIELKKAISKKKENNIKDVTTCEATARCWQKWPTVAHWMLHDGWLLMAGRVLRPSFSSF